jgi:hypothetical protein
MAFWSLLSETADTTVDPDCSEATPAISAAAAPAKAKLASITELMSIIVFTPFRVVRITARYRSHDIVALAFARAAVLIISGD